MKFTSSQPSRALYNPTIIYFTSASKNLTHFVKVLLVKLSDLLHSWNFVRLFHRQSFALYSKAEWKSWKCLGLLMIIFIFWSVISSLTAYNISFTILSISLLVSHWRQRRFQCGKRVADRVSAARSRGCSRRMIEASLEMSQIVHWK